MSAADALWRGWKLDLHDPDAPNGFDALRFLAATLVLIGHAWPLTGRKPDPFPGGWDTLGGVGVAVFFVISGFLVAASRERSATVGSFLHKRALRILPGFLLMCLVAVFLLGPALTTLRLADYFDHPQARLYFANVTMFDVQLALPGVFAANIYPHAVNGSTWTLPIEVFMYLILAVGGALLLERWRMLVIAIAAMVAYFFYAHRWALSGAHLWTTLPLYYTVKYGIFFALGTCAYLWREEMWLSPALAAVLWGAAFALASTAYAIVPYMLALSYSTLLFAALPWPVLTGFGRWGDFSYGMYLFAFPVQQTVVHFAGASLPLPWNIALCFAVTLLCAALSWHLVERPALALKAGAHVR